MARIYPFQYISLGGGWTIKVNPNHPLGKAGILCTGTDGLFETGVSTSSGVERQYANGTVLPSVNILQGKSFNLTIVFHGSPTSIYNDLESFQNYVMQNKFTLTNGVGSIEKCMGQQVRIEEELYSEEKMYLTVSVEIISEKSYFAFN